MKYLVNPQDDTVMVAISDNGETQEILLNEAPDKGNMLVEYCVKDVLGEINLTKMLTNLDHCVDLLQITFNAVDGFSVQSDVQELTHKFINAMTKSNAYALAFKSASDTVLEAYIDAYQCLFSGDIKIALQLLGETKNVARKMVEKASELVTIFDELSTHANDVLKKVLIVRADDEKKRAETVQIINELEGSISAMNQIKESLAKEIKNYEKDYTELLEREVRQEKRSYNLQIASIVMVGLGTIFGKGSNENASNIDERNEAEEYVGDATQDSTEEGAKTKYSNNVMSQKQKESQLKNIDATIEKIDDVLNNEKYKGGEHYNEEDTSNPYTKKTADELRDEKKNLMDEKETIHNDINTLQGEKQALESTLQNFGVAMKELSESTAAAADKLQEKADSLAKRAEIIREKRDELKEQERSNLAALAKNTAAMQNMVMDKNSLESAIQCLVIAVSCLRKVLAYVSEVKEFWSKVEVYCENLQDNGSLKILIEGQSEKSIEDKARYFKTILFVKSYINSLARWRALSIIFDEYMISLATVSSRMMASLEQEISAKQEDQWKLAKKLASNLEGRLKIELQDN